MDARCIRSALSAHNIVDAQGPRDIARIQMMLRYGQNGLASFHAQAGRAEASVKLSDKS